MIDGYHAHIYFSPGQDANAIRLADQLEAKFGDAIKRGRWHEKPVGPHPRGSCQISFASHQFEKVMPWLMLNRSGVTIFVHPQTGDDLRDHTDHVVWLGDSEALRLEVFRRD